MPLDVNAFIVAEFSIAAALDIIVPTVVVPVTPNVPPIVLLFATFSEFKEAKPVDDKVDNDVFPVIPSVPPIVLLLVTDNEFKAALFETDNDPVSDVVPVNAILLMESPKLIGP